VLARLDARAGDPGLLTLTDWAPPVQRRHSRKPLDGALKLAADADPEEEA
jgi:hypothetical protein